MSSNLNSATAVDATSEFHPQLIAAWLAPQLVWEEDVRALILGALEKARPDLIEEAKREIASKEAERARRREGNRADDAERPQRLAARAANAAYWSEGTRIEDALAAAFADAERRPVPDGGLCIWMTSDGVEAAGFSGRDALRRAVRASLERWPDAARDGEFRAHEDAIDWLNGCVYQGGPLFVEGENDVIDNFLRHGLQGYHSLLEEFADELQESRGAHWTPEARRAAIDRFWAETWPELVDQVEERQGPHLWISREGPTHAGWSARGAFRAAIEAAVFAWDDSASGGEHGPDEGPETVARAWADGWALEMNGPVEMVATLLSDLPIRQCNAFAEELLAKATAEVR